MNFKSPFDVDFSKVSLPTGATRELIEQRYKSSLDDLGYLNMEYANLIGNRKASTRIMAIDLWNTIMTTVYYNDNDEIDTTILTKLVPNPDRDLYAAIVKMVYGIVHEKPKTPATLTKFKTLLCYYLILAEF